jgi:hypothetical protein
MPLRVGASIPLNLCPKKKRRRRINNENLHEGKFLERSPKLKCCFRICDQRRRPHRQLSLL